MGLASVVGLEMSPGVAWAHAHHEQVDKAHRHADKAVHVSAAQRDYLVMLAELALGRQQAALAAQAYVKALQGSHDAALAKRATQVALAARRHKLAYRAARVWADSAPEDVAAQQMALRLALVNGNGDDVRHFAQRLMAQVKSSREAYERLVQILSGHPKQADLALQVAGELAKQHPHEIAAQYAQARLALAYGRLQQAGELADALLKRRKNWPEARMIKAELALRQGDADKARQWVNGIQGSARERAEYQVKLGQMLVQAHDRKAALAVFKRAVGIDGDYSQARYNLGVVALSQDEPDIASVQFKMLYQADSHRNDAAYYLGVIAQQQGHVDRAIDWYGKVEGGSHVLEAGVRIVQLTYYKQGEHQKAIDHLAGLIDEYPQKITRLSAIQGNLLANDNQLEAAIKVFSRALEDTPDDDELRYGRALAYEKSGQLKAARKDLHNILSRNGDNADALNALGYLMVTHDQDYQKAQEYIRRALKLSPQAPAILDSMGWVNFKRGRLNKARQYLEQAYKGAADPEIAAHLGEVLWQQGDRDKARHIWHKALLDHPDHPVLKQTIKRLDP